MSDQSYLLGQLLTVLISDGWAEFEDSARIVSNLRGTLNPCLARATQSGDNAKITELIAQIGEIPVALSNEQWSSFWLGFYHRKRGPGRPKGTVKTDGLKNAHDITVTDEAWLYAKAQGNASSFIESLILAHKGTA